MCKSLPFRYAGGFLLFLVVSDSLVVDTNVRFVVYAASLDSAKLYAAERSWRDSVWLFVTDSDAPELPRVYVRDFGNEWDL